MRRAAPERLLSRRAIRPAAWKDALHLLQPIYSNDTVLTSNRHRPGPTFASQVFPAATVPLGFPWQRRCAMARKIFRSEAVKISF